MSQNVMKEFATPTPERWYALDEVIFGENVYKCRAEGNTYILSRQVECGRQKMSVNMRFSATQEEHDRSIEAIRVLLRHLYSEYFD